MKALLLGVLIALPSPDTLPVPDAYRAALEAGTRSRTGAPGPTYWTNKVDYAIETRLEPATNRVHGSEVVTVHNRSPRALGQVALNLNQNVFAPGNPRNRPAPITGGFDLTSLTVQGTAFDLTPRRGPSVPTNVVIDLPRAVPSGGEFELRVELSFEVPEGTFRMGREGSEAFYLAQWYPQVAVYDELRGWVRDPYMGDGEFYVDYGDFDVRISAPEGWLVGATGVLQNPGDVLRPGSVERLAEAAPDRVVHVVTAQQRASGQATAASEDGWLEWHFIAENVRDFAWGASDRYVWDATVAAYPEVGGGERTSMIHSLYRPERPNWERAASFAKHAIEFHSRWYPYPYPQMTVNEGVIGGGMEYPMITIIGGGRTPISLYAVTSHELAHMWWPMVVGSDEKAHAWMDEGLASFSEDLSTPTLFTEVNSGLNTLRGYLGLAGRDAETESMRHADLYGPFGNRGMASYGKPASVFRALRAVLGEDTFDEALREYTRRWAFKHPHPLDLFWTFEDVTGEDLDWFFYPWMYTTRVMDQGIDGVRISEDGRRVRVFLEDRGEIPMPILMEFRVAGQAPVSVWADHDEWEDGRFEVEVGLPGDLGEILLDARPMLPDVNRADNAWRPGPR
jgi:hypothetical protein